ncbi:MAG: hypothetical protein US60_C0002G0039 [Microgenomates group bacterium GW2011_GWC1_37_8]|uniref:Uncharacterized protein n=1 Tax=Candidatus Woesebacteria bacterium GW2011_GWB1_38_8 TaxID=1618570 RepID=A0A0G0L382_9BACT|nr:MAG: hypothetical protein US60_C0002G0039 [Microgenomates group bacterium GW2011_GWC1_37_8]KKQ85477.1 MAG: hypothetical protein UT08_C0006G0060 [Candidatus Woesebacteria bacterium GW2011_GWB1_38_8]
MRKALFFIPPFLLTILLLLFSVSDLYATTVDLRHLTFGFYREDWPVIYKDKILWLDEGIVKGYNFTEQNWFTLFEGEQPLADLYGLVGFDGRYVAYINATDENSFDVNAYDLEEGKNIVITDKSGTQWATDYDQKTVIYIDGAPCGNLIAYNLSNKNSMLITEHACYAKISGNNIVWAYGNSIYGYYLNRNEQFMITPNGAHPDIYGNNAIWLSKEEDTTFVNLKNLKTGEERVLNEAEDYGITWPAISKRYVVWGKTTSQHVAGVEGVDLITGEVFEIQDQGNHQNGVIAPQIEGNIVAWMAWRTGNGDIYAAEINK